MNICGVNRAAEVVYDEANSEAVFTTQYLIVLYSTQACVCRVKKNLSEFNTVEFLLGLLYSQSNSKWKWKTKNADFLLQFAL